MYGYLDSLAATVTRGSSVSKTRRQWDARIGRWLSVDPSRQYYSSYLGMDNNPVIGVDPDGRFSRFGAWWRSKFISNSYTYNTGTEWAVGWDTWENDGQGAYLLGHSITEGGPGISGNYKLDFITTANATYKFGFNQVLDQGLVGFSADMGSLEAVKFNIDPQKFDGNNMSDIMEWQTPNNLTQGIRVETPYGDVKYKLNFDPSTGNLKTLEVGIGAPFIEAKVILDHNGVHTIRLGSQEDIGRSVNGHALTIDYFTGLSFHRKR